AKTLPPWPKLGSRVPGRGPPAAWAPGAAAPANAITTTVRKTTPLVPMSALNRKAAGSSGGSDRLRGRPITAPARSEAGRGGRSAVLATAPPARLGLRLAFGVVLLHLHAPGLVFDLLLA